SPTPTSTALSRAPAVYPAALLNGGMLDAGYGGRVQPFGTAGREGGVLRALRRGGGPRRHIPPAEGPRPGSPGPTEPQPGARRARWFLVSGGFRYSDHPRVVTPPLVGFVTQTRSGYCQYFAGAMALMLRYLGISARVAVGFAGPAYDRASGTWVVTDHNAHAW